MIETYNKRAADFVSDLRDKYNASYQYRNLSTDHLGYHEVDLLGEAIAFVEETFPNTVIYHRFESVFDVPDEVLMMLQLKYDAPVYPMLKVTV